MTVHPRSPVLIGVGQVSNRVDRGADELEPVDLMARAVEVAVADAGAAVLDAVDTVRVVGLLSWRYQDAARSLARSVGLDDRVRTGVSSMGGNSPQSLVNQTAKEIVAGDIDAALLSGGEAWRTRMKYRRNDGAKPPWSALDESIAPAPVIGPEMQMSNADELALGLGMPVQVYPMFEQARRHRLGRSIDEHMASVAELWARFSQVAAENPYAWRQEALTAEQILDPGDGNRYVGYPYTKVMNSYENVDQGAALLLCSAERAESLGVPRDRWVFVHAGADAREHPFLSDRASLDTSPAIGVAGRALFAATGSGPDTIDHLDLYSCFPAAVQFGAEELGLDPARQLTQTGGLAFAGGPWNNYSMHGIASLVSTLRGDAGSTGFVWANGGFFTKHAMGLYSTAPTPADRPFVHCTPQAEVDALPSKQLASDHDGPVTVESWTVMHDATNTPQIAYAATLTPSGDRAWARTTDPAAMASMVGAEMIGRDAERGADAELRL